MRSGNDARLANDIKTRAVRHVRSAVYGEMLLQITRNYGGLPDPRTLKAYEIRFFYEGIRGEIREQTKPRSKR